MSKSLKAITLVVDDYDEAIDYYTNSLGFALIEDTQLTPSKRWVLVATTKEAETRILLAKADGAVQESAIGNQTGGRVFLFLNTQDFETDYERMISKGVKFLEEPRHEEYGAVAVFEDIYGNKWDLLQLKK